MAPQVGLEATFARYFKDLQGTDGDSKDLMVPSVTVK